jgi:hypothetical protein
LNRHDLDTITKAAPAARCSQRIKNVFANYLPPGTLPQNPADFSQASISYCMVNILYLEQCLFNVAHLIRDYRVETHGLTVGRHNAFIAETVRRGYDAFIEHMVYVERNDPVKPRLDDSDEFTEAKQDALLVRIKDYPKPEQHQALDQQVDQFVKHDELPSLVMPSPADEVFDAVSHNAADECAGPG